MSSTATAEPIQHQVRLETPFSDQKPGTSACAKAANSSSNRTIWKASLKRSSAPSLVCKEAPLVLGGDGRYGNRRAIDVILRMAAAHGVSKVITTTGGILSTPAASNLIRSRKAIGGIILSASHNPGGPNGDFGVKVNGANGGPTPASFTDAVYECTKISSSIRSLMLQPSVSIPRERMASAPWLLK